MIRAGAIALLVSAAASPALATEWVVCSDAADEATVSILVGTTDWLSVAGVKLSARGQSWVSSPEYGEGTAIAVAQGYAERDMALVDFTDAAMSERIGELRLFIADEGDDFVFGGTLRVSGVGAWAVSCSGP
jgi:hypothetical protein